MYATMNNIRNLYRGLMGNTTTLREKFYKKLKTTRILAISFAFVILTGGILLSLPISNINQGIPFIDHLFMSTSSVCVTGLVTVIIVDNYTLFGQWVIIFLMQIGGLGLMTLLVTIMTVAKKHLYVAEKKLMQDSLNKADLQDVPKYIKSIIKYTFIFEGLGTLLFCIRLIPMYGFTSGLFKAFFLSVSAFCNAGLDNFSQSSLIPYNTDPILNIGVALLIITGGLGFAVWFDLTKGFTTKFKMKTSFKQMFNHFSLHSKVVLTVTSILLGLGTLLFFIIEYNNPNTIANNSFLGKVLISFFQSTTLRTAGFSSINIGSCRTATLLIMCLWMLIGGSPGGTAGGIKTTTFTVLVLSIVSAFKNTGDHYRVFKREIPRDTFVKGFVILFMYLSALLLAVLILSFSDEKILLLDVLVETFSAINTVGISTGITTSLSNIGKIVIILLMYIGRVGPITIVLSLFKNRSNKREVISFAHEDVLVG